MTGTEKIKAKILEDASQMAKDIEEQAKEEARRITDAAKREAEEKRKEILQKGESDGAESYRRLLAVAGLEGRKERLKAKQDMVENAFKAAMERIISMPDAKYQKFLEDMVVSAAEKGEGELLLSEKDLSRMDRQFIESINKKLEHEGKNGNLKMSQKTIRAAGGFILKCGEMEINSTLEILFGMLRPELENEIVDILFGA